MAGRLRVKVGVQSQTVQRLTAALAAVERKAARAATRAGINEVTKLVLKDARDLAPKRSGQLKRVLGRKVRTYRQTVVVGVIGPRRGFRVVIGGVAVDPTKYAHLQEFGRAAVRAGQRTVLSGGRRRAVKTGSRVLSSFYTAVAPDAPKVFGPAVGPAAPRPFLRPAWERNRRLASAVVARHLQAVFERIAGRGSAARVMFSPPPGDAGD